MQRLCFLFILLLLGGCDPTPEKAALSRVPERIISLAPDATEIVYALGLGDKLMGATTYCVYPDAAKEVPRVGGFGQYNFESIVSLKPDLVILHWKYENEKARLQGLGIPYLETRTELMADILESINTIGVACGAEQEAAVLIADIRKRILKHQKSGPAPRVLITFGGDSSNIDQIYAFGADCLHNELLELAGGINVVENKLAFSTLSKEAIFRLNPDIIIQLSPGTEAIDAPSTAWEELSGITAVENKQVYMLTGDYTCIPGPRFIEILEDFARIISPDEQL